MTLDEAKDEVTSKAEIGMSREKIEKIAKLYHTQVSDWRASVTEEEWRARSAEIQSDLLHEILLTH